MVGVSMSDPNAPSWAKPMSSSRMTTTFGAPTGFGRVGNHAVESASVRPMTPAYWWSVATRSLPTD